MFWCHSLGSEMLLVTFDFECTYIKKREWLFHCNTGTFRKPKIPLPCFMMSLDNYVNVKTCSGNRWSHSSEQLKNHAKSSRQAFPSMLTFVSWNRKNSKMLLVSERMFCYTPSLNIAKLI